VISYYEWDNDKAATNRRKHGVSFEEAASVFADDDAVINDDVAHADEKDRFIIVGAAGARRRTEDGPMSKKSAANVDDDPLDHEIDFSNAQPNPFARDFYKSKNVRILAPDLLDVFPNSEAVNEALRTLVRITSSAVALKRSAKTAAAPKAARKKAHS
jgi:hypothetical protein